jgi:hypothetical protein
VNRLPRQCGILNISQPYNPPHPVTGIALLFLLYTSASNEGISYRPTCSEFQCLFLPIIEVNQRSLYSDWLRVGCRGIGVRVPVEESFLSSPRCPDWLRGTDQPRKVPGVLYWGKIGRGVKLTTYLQLMPRSTHPLPHTPSSRSA